MRSYGQSWTEEDIKKALELVVKDTGITHFPTHRELNEYYGNSSLSVRLTRTGGTRKWSKILNLPPSACSNTKLGNKYELKAITDIKQETGLDSELTIERYPYDIYTGNGVKVDIKTSMPMKGRNFDCWTFNLEKKIPTCDFYIFYCIDRIAEIKKRIIIPSCVLYGIAQVGIGSLSKYDNYIERWDLIMEYDNFLKEIKNKISLIPKRRTTD